MKKSSLSKCLWWLCVYFVRACGLIFYLSPKNLPGDEGQKLLEEAASYDFLIIVNAGGWGDVPLNRAADFTPILDGIREALSKLGYSSRAVSYNRTNPGLLGRMYGIKEQLNSFKNTSQRLAENVEQLVAHYQEKHFILAGFSIGGALTVRTMYNLNNLPNVYGITVGAPGWFKTYSSEKSLVLNNNNLDPLSTGNIKVMAINVIKSPYIWLKARLAGCKLSLALSLQFPDHNYSWDSPEVGPPIIKFLDNYIKPKWEKHTGKG